MNDIDIQQEWRRLEKAYAGMSEEELGGLAEKAYELTEIAQQALRAHISSRGLEIELTETPSAPRGRLDPDGLDLIGAAYVSTLDEAQRVMRVLREAGIPAYLEVQVQGVDGQRALRALAVARREGEHDEVKPYLALCPYCHSEEIVFEEVVPEAKAPGSASAEQYRWRCDNCGKEWEDDGLEDGSGGQ